MKPDETTSQKNTVGGIFDDVDKFLVQRDTLRNQVLALRAQLEATRVAQAQNETWLRVNAPLVRARKAVTQGTHGKSARVMKS